MGWKGYEEEMSLGMLFRKMYCFKCENKLNKHKISKIYHKREKGYQNHILGHSTIGMDKIELATYVYKCPNCGHEITYDDQCIIAKIQKKLKKKVLTQDEISDYCSTH